MIDLPSRRELVTGAGAALLAGTGGSFLTACGDRSASARPADKRGHRKPRNTILMISDGMSLGVPSLAEPFSQRVRGRGTRWGQLLTQPDVAHGLLATGSANSLVTDSAAAGTALSAGERIHNGQLNTRPDGSVTTPLAHRLQPAGCRVGLVTTDLMCGATPSAFAAACEDRNRFEHLAPQFLDRADVLMGGGRDHFDPLGRSDGRDLFAEYSRAGYQLLLDRDDVLTTWRGERVLGLFDRSRLPYTIDHRHDGTLRDRIPTLAEMTAAALRCLDASGMPYFLMVEAARVDHAAHANDAAALLWDQLAFDDAADVALRHADERGDTLVILTSDHGNANPGLNGMGDRYTGTDSCFERLGGATASFQGLNETLKADASQGLDTLQQRITGTLGVELSKRELEDVLAVIDDTVADPHEVTLNQRKWSSMLGQILGNHTGIFFTSRQHTQDHVLCTAVGPGADQLTGLRHHTDLSRFLQSLVASA